MIEAEYIKEWRADHPWSTNAMVEQDMIISRALIAVFSDPFLRGELAFRGGTALHKLYLKPQPRYSEDIDLVQIHPGPIRPIMDHLREALDFLGSPSTKTTRMSNKLIYRFVSEIEPVEPMRLKVEINCREHFHVLPWVYFPFSMRTAWFSGEALLTTYELDELLGTKMRALFQRKKGRDLFDLAYALKHAAVNHDPVLRCFVRYMMSAADKVPTYKEFSMNMEEKLSMRDFVCDTAPIVLPSVRFSADEAYDEVDRALLRHIDLYRSQL